MGTPSATPSDPRGWVRGPKPARTRPGTEAADPEGQGSGTSPAQQPATRPAPAAQPTAARPASVQAPPAADRTAPRPAAGHAPAAPATAAAQPVRRQPSPAARPHPAPRPAPRPAQRTEPAPASRTAPPASPRTPGPVTSPGPAGTPGAPKSRPGPPKASGSAGAASARRAAADRATTDRSAEAGWGEPKRRRPLRGKSPDEIGWVKAHGGAGATSLCELLGGVDVGARWPEPAKGEPRRIVIVGRTSAQGIRAVSQALGALHEGKAPQGLDLVAVVLVADAPNRLPLSLLRRIRVIRSVVHVHRVPWIPAWRVGGRPRSLPRKIGALAQLVGTDVHRGSTAS